MRLCLIAGCLLLPALVAPCLALAQVVSPIAADTQARFDASELHFDRSDVHCAGKLPDAMCEVPGTPLAGGGKGVCVREIDADEQHINLRCKVIPGPDIRRAIPDGPFAAPDLVCGEQVPEPAPDRFCAGKSPGDACTVDYTLRGEPLEEAGVCTPGEETSEVQFRGEWTLRRPLLTCEAATPVPPPAWRELTWWQRLWQW